MFKVYYTDPMNNQAYSWDCTSLADSLTIAERFRREGMIFVTMVSENPHVVGKPGVDAVSEDNVLPDGTPYTWKKRRK
jgi:hypothetical protein